MTHQHICRFSGTTKDGVLQHILWVLLQSQQDRAEEIVFDRSCSKCDGEFHMVVAGRRYYLGMPPGVSGWQVRKTLLAVTGLENSTKFPKDSEFVLELPEESEFILEFPRYKGYEPIETTGWRRMRWLVSLASPEGQIALRSVP